MGDKIRVIFVVVFLMSMAGLCRADQASGTLKPVNEAYLRVYTRAEEVNDGGYLWERSMPYTVFSAEGKKIKRVMNDNGIPNKVILPAGKYQILPDGGGKDELIDVTLEQGKLTELHLQ